MSSSPCRAVLDMMATTNAERYTKKAAFDALYALDYQGDEPEDKGLMASFRTVEHKTLRDPTISSTRRRGTSPGSLTRSFSTIITPLPQSKLKRPKNPRELLEEYSNIASSVKDTPPLHPQHLQPSLMPSSSAPPASSAIPLIKLKKGKCKQQADIHLVPENMRIFQGLHFCKEHTNFHPAITHICLPACIQTSFQIMTNILLAHNASSKHSSMVQHGRPTSTTPSLTLLSIAQTTFRTY
jgi:hypothetical protein